jgi:hypothetical protein
MRIVRGTLDERELAALVVVLARRRAAASRRAAAAARREARERRPRWDAEDFSGPSRSPSPGRPPTS